MPEDNKTMSETEIAASLNRAFDSSALIFHSRSEALGAFKQGREIVFEDGEPFALYDGVIQPLGDALAKFGADNRGYIDGRSLPRAGVDASRPGVLSKNGFASLAEKVAYIAEHGAEAFEKLPLQTRDTSELTHQSQWYKLNIAERVRLTSLDPDAFSKLKPGPKPGGTYINEKALAKELATRGRR
jgi:hypothetical protein